DGGAAKMIQALRFIGGARKLDRRSFDRAALFISQLFHLQVVLRRVLAVKIDGRDRHRAVNVDGELRREASFALESAQVIEHFLRATDGECGNQQNAGTVDDALAYARERLFRVLGAVQTVAVRGFQQDVVRACDRLGVLQDRNAFSPDVAREKDA